MDRCAICATLLPRICHTKCSKVFSNLSILFMSLCIFNTVHCHLGSLRRKVLDTKNKKGFRDCAIRVINIGICFVKHLVFLSFGISQQPQCAWHRAKAKAHINKNIYIRNISYNTNITNTRKRTSYFGQNFPKVFPSWLSSLLFPHTHMTNFINHDGSTV